jgi:pyridoxamine 5'-phosphate oxidase family protein
VHVEAMQRLVEVRQGRSRRLTLAPMSAFTQGEIDYLHGQLLARMATVGPDGQPHLIPVTYVFNEEQDAIDIGGIDFASGKKWRDARQNPRVTLLVDDSPGPGQARAIEIRGQVELHTTGGEKINRRFPTFVPEFFRLRPTKIVSWGLGAGEADVPEGGFRPYSRSV